MNVYDFDGTIFYSDCSIGFAVWCMKRHPKLCATYLPRVVKNLILYKTGKIPNHLMQRRLGLTFRDANWVDRFQKNGTSDSRLDMASLYGICALKDSANRIWLMRMLRWQTLRGSFATDSSIASCSPSAMFKGLASPLAAA